MTGGSSENNGAAPPPLQGVRVLDLSRVLAGPLAAMALGDLGAEVIKVENPNGGDDTRHWGPPFHEGVAGYFLAFNRNKRSITIDLKNPEGAALIRELAARSDILIENYRLGTLDDLGLGAEALMTLNPGLIFASVSGYGRTGPRAAEAGYDFVIQAESGLMSITGDRDGEPHKVGLPISDIVTGLTLSQTILAALYARHRDGKGQHIDMALLEAQQAVMGNIGTGALITGLEAARFGNAHPNIVPYQVFYAVDAPFVIACGNDRQFGLLCERVLERPDLSGDRRFASNTDRVANRDALEKIIADIVAAAPADDWIARLRGCGIPAGKVRGVLEALATPEAEARGVVQAPDADADSELNLIRSAHRLSRTPIDETFRPPPALGADSQAVLTDVLELSPDRIAALQRSGALGSAN